ncbi:MAG: hypothetical protein IJ496_08810, partial [Ruminococcus sp.]|nr:hypothetical protein [Ruminococcus sp.]
SITQKLSDIFSDKTLLETYTETFSETERSELTEALEHVTLHHASRTEKSLTEQLYSLTETEQEELRDYLNERYIGKSITQKLSGIFPDKTLLEAYETFSETERSELTEALEHVTLNHASRTEKSLTEQLYSLTETEQDVFFEHLAQRMRFLSTAETYTTRTLDRTLYSQWQAAHRLNMLLHEKTGAIQKRYTIQSSIFHLQKNEHAAQETHQYSIRIPTRFVHLKKRIENIETEFYQPTAQANRTGNIQHPGADRPMQQRPYSSLYHASSASTTAISDDVAEQLESLSQQVQLQKQKLSQMSYQQQKRERRLPALSSREMERIAEEVMQYMDRKSHTIKRKNGIF